MDYILLNIKEEEDDIDVETVELQFENNKNNDYKLFESSSMCIPGSLSSVANVKINTLDMKKNVHVVANDLGMNLKGGAENKIVSILVLLLLSRF